MVTLSLLTAIFGSCSNEETANSDTGVLRIRTDNVVTRSVITDTILSKGDQIGVFAMNTNNNEYATGSSNMQAVTNDGTNWSFSSATTHLTSAEAKVYAYYPYAANNTLHKVSVNIRPSYSSGQSDYLYGASINNVNIDNPEAKIKFKFALSRITFKITKSKDNVNDELMISNIKLSNVYDSTSISTNGYMDILTGDIAKTKNTNDSVYDATSAYLSENDSKAHFANLLVIPTVVNSNVLLSMTINNKVFTVHIPNITWLKGCQYTYPVTFTKTEKSSGQLILGTCIINPWVNNNENGIICHSY